jgi:hypothetical protein
LPYLMIYSGTNLGGNDAIQPRLGRQYSERHFPNLTHMDLHDASIALPLMRWFGGNSVASATSSKLRLIEAVATFLDAHRPALR